MARLSATQEGDERRARRTAPDAHGEPDLPAGLTGEIRRILVGTDLGSSSEPATDWAFALGSRHGAELVVLSVIDPRELRQAPTSARLRWDQVRRRRESAALRLVQRGQAIGVRVSFLVWTGNPGEAIVEAARAEQADLVLVGSHGRGAIRRLLLGSVTEHVVRRAPCPVLVVRPTPGASPAA